MTEISVVASTFPPESTAATGPEPSTRPASSAATPAAPAPSTTSFVRSRTSTIARAISALDTSTIESRRSLEDRARQLSQLLDGDAVGDGESLRRRPHADEAYPGAHGLETQRNAGRQATTADRDDDRLHVLELLGELQPHGALPGDDVAVLERVHVDGPGLLRQATAGRHCLLEARTGHLDGRAVAASRLDLRHRCVLGDDDRRRHARLARRPGHRLPVIAGARGHDTLRALVVGQRRHAIDSSSHLE